MSRGIRCFELWSSRCCSGTKCAVKKIDRDRTTRWLFLHTDESITGDERHSENVNAVMDESSKTKEDHLRESKRQRMDSSDVETPNVCSLGTTTRDDECAFCHSFRITESSGPMQHFSKNGNPVSGEEAYQRGVRHVHRECANWSPRVFYNGEIVMNLNAEIVRASQLKCSSCGKNGAALGCYYKKCRRSYHVPCANQMPGCRLDGASYHMLCPSHTNQKITSNEAPWRMKKPKVSLPASNQVDDSALPVNTNSPRHQGHNAAFIGLNSHWVLCGSALSKEQKELMHDLAMMTNAAVVEAWDPSVTHVIASTNDSGACRRTLKVLMATLGGKWVLTIEWVRACLKASKPVEEEPYEVGLDIHGCKNGPRTGRLMVMRHEEQGLLSGLSFRLSGSFPPSRKCSLLQLVQAAGGSIVDKNSAAAPSKDSGFVVYSADPPWEDEASGSDGCRQEQADVERRFLEAEALAEKTKSRVVAYTRILEAIAALDRQLLLRDS